MCRIVERASTPPRAGQALVVIRMRYIAIIEERSRSWQRVRHAFTTLPVHSKLPPGWQLATKAVNEVSANYEGSKRIHIRLEEDQTAYQRGQGKAVEENVPQDVTLVAVPLRSSTGHHNALGVDHLAHNAARAVG